MNTETMNKRITIKIFIGPYYNNKKVILGYVVKLTDLLLKLLTNKGYLL